MFKIVLSVHAGVVTVDQELSDPIVKDCQVFVHDYDIDGADYSISNILTDKQGNEYDQYII